MAHEIRSLTGPALVAALDDVAALRLAVFRDWPYLYDGDLAYEQRYLEPYVRSDKAIVVGAYAQGQLVGASTGAPLADHAADFGAAFAGQDIDIDKIFYCAESVLLPAWRGQGIGHAFFDVREGHARRQGFQKICFCSVIRPPDHPLRPQGYRPLDGFWRKRGYRMLPGVMASFAWTDVGETTETAKALQVWMRDL